MPQTPETLPDPQRRKSSLRKWLVQLVLPLAAGVALIAAVVLLGGTVRERLRQEGGKLIDFTEIECDPPEGLTRLEFLQQVQYLANLPDQLNLLDADTSPRIVEALSAHPLVAEVQRVEQLPPGRLRVQLAYRVAVLSVANPLGVVDRDGVLLPSSCQRKDLPLLQARVAFPMAGPGHPWGDETVKAAAAVAGLLHHHLQTLKLQGCLVELDKGDIVLRTPGTKVLWGRPPGRERPEEARAERKLQRLLERPNLDGQEHDLRSAACVHRRMPAP
jgi:hypothetical protein